MQPHTHARTCAPTHTFTLTHTHSHTHIITHTFTYTHTHSNTHKNTQTHTHLHIYKHKHSYIRTPRSYKHTCARVRACVRVRSQAVKRTRVLIQNKHTSLGNFFHNILHNIASSQHVYRKPTYCFRL